MELNSFTQGEHGILSDRLDKLCRLAVALGGFLMMMGVILLGGVVLTLLNVIDVTAFMNETYSVLFMIALLSIGIINLVAGLILSRR